MISAIIIAAISLVTVLSVIGALAYRGYTLKKNYDSQFANLINQITDNQNADIATEKADMDNINDIRDTYETKESLNENVTTQELFADNARITNAEINRAHITDAQIAKAKIDDSYISNAKIANAQIANAKIAKTQIDRAHITDAEIDNNNISNAQIANARIANAQIDKTHITYAEIDNTNISNADITSVNARRATINDLTTSQHHSDNIISKTADLNNLNSSQIKLSGKGSLNFSSTDKDASSDPYTFQRGVNNRANELILKTSGKFSITDNEMKTKFSIDSKTNDLSLGDASITQSGNNFHLNYLDTQNNLLPMMSMDKNHNMTIGLTANQLKVGSDSYFPLGSDQNTYIRPGKDGKDIMIGDVMAKNVNVGNAGGNVGLYGTTYMKKPVFMLSNQFNLDGNGTNAIKYDSKIDGTRIWGNKGGSLSTANGKNALYWDDNENTYTAGALHLNKHALRLAGSNDETNVLYYNSDVDGPYLQGNSGGKLDNAMSWSNNGKVQIGANSFMPNDDMNTYIRPGANDKNIYIGDSLTKTISMGQSTTDIDIQGSLNLNDRPLVFGPSSRKTSGIGYYDSNTSFGGYAPEGPIMYGNNGGGLGSLSTGPMTALKWDSNAQVEMNNIRFSNKYSKFTDAGINNSEISNDTSTYKQLMIVGNKSGGTRKVGVWDMMEVNGDFNSTGKVEGQFFHSRGNAQIDKSLIVNGPIVAQGTPAEQIMINGGGDSEAARLRFSAEGPSSGWFGKIQADNIKPNSEGPVPLMLNPEGGHVTIGKDGLDTIGSLNARGGFTASGASEQIKIMDGGIGGFSALTFGAEGSDKGFYGKIQARNTDPKNKGPIPLQLNPEGGDVTVGNLSARNIAAGGATAADIKLSKGWTGYPDNAKDRSEISNDINGFKQLMIVGNKSAGAERRVGIWDRLDVHGELGVDSSATIKGDMMFNGRNNWILHTPDDGRHTMYVAPSKTQGQRDWDWNVQTTFDPNGMVSSKYMQSRDALCVGRTCFNESQLKTMLVDDHATLLALKKQLESDQASITSLTNKITELQKSTSSIVTPVATATTPVATTPATATKPVVMTIRVNDTVYDGLSKKFGPAGFAINAGQTNVINAFKQSKSFSVDGQPALNFKTHIPAVWNGKDVITYGPTAQAFKSYKDHQFTFYS